jgi:hypothetical protein
MKSRVSIVFTSLVFSFLLLAPLVGRAQPGVTNFIVAGFDTTNEVADPTTGTGVWSQWFGSFAPIFSWDSKMDASNNPNSGSMKVITTWTGGSQQAMVWDGAGGINPPIDGTTVTNFQCDIRFDPSSCTTTFGTFGNLHFGSRGTGFSQPMFGPGANVAVSSTNTGWVHISLPVDATANALWTTLPDVIFQMETYGAPMSGTNIMWLDNVKFTGPAAGISNPPPTMTILKTSPGLRNFAASTASIYDREELATVDQSQSWIGGTFPVSYSFTLLSYPNDINLGQTHIFLLPANFTPGGPYSYNGIDFTATNELWLNIAPITTTSYRAVVAWKTNNPAANPDQTALTITNSTVIGTWTLTFTGETNGTLTAPGASPVPFTIADPTIEADFGNPMVAYFGLQPNGGAGEGEYEDWASIKVTGVTGVNENEDFTKEAAISADWMNMSAVPGALQLASTNTPVWIKWTTPDTGFGLEASGTVNGVNGWFSPAYYTGFGADAPVPTKMGNNGMWTLIPIDALPTTDGSQLGTPAPNGFFRLSNPPPAQ